MFSSSGSNSRDELNRRKSNKTPPMRFGVEYLDACTRGIFEDDLILLGAPSGVGKTQLCCNIALANLEDGKRVHYLALEASQYEIERRLKYPHIAERFFAQKKNFPDIRLDFPDWLMGKYCDALSDIEEEVDKYFTEAYRDLFTFYKNGSFGVKELVESIHYCADDTDLIMIDHVHYFDFDDDNENRAIKEIAKTVRDMALKKRKPIILVAHLRKRNKQTEELAADLDEFHGSSDLYKIATKVVTFSPGPPQTDGTYETYFRVPKNRLDGGVTRYIGKEYFDPKTGGYLSGKYQVGKAGGLRAEGFKPIDESYLPGWARRGSASGGGVYPVLTGPAGASENRRGRPPYADGD